MFDPEPKREWGRVPGRIPEKIVPSLIGESGLVGCYLFYSGLGDELYDFSGEENHGTIKGPSWSDGPYGWASDFNGTTDHVLLPTFPAFSEFTIIIWSMHRSVYDGDSDFDLVLRTGNNGIQINDGGNGNYVMYIYDGAWNNVRSPVSNDVWNMWTMRYDGSVMEGFKNSPPSFGSYSTTTYTGTGEDRHAFGSADPGLSSNYLDGKMALAWIFSEAKPDSFIDSLFQETRGMFGV